MWSLFILLPLTLWAIAILIRLLWKWLPPGDEVRRPPQAPTDKS